MATLCAMAAPALLGSRSTGAGIGASLERVWENVAAIGSICPGCNRESFSSISLEARGRGAGWWRGGRLRRAGRGAVIRLELGPRATSGRYLSRRTLAGPGAASRDLDEARSGRTARHTPTSRWSFLIPDGRAGSPRRARRRLRFALTRGFWDQDEAIDAAPAASCWINRVTPSAAARAGRSRPRGGARRAPAAARGVRRRAAPVVCRRAVDGEAARLGTRCVPHALGPPRRRLASAGRTPGVPVARQGRSMCTRGATLRPRVAAAAWSAPPGAWRSRGWQRAAGERLAAAAKAASSRAAASGVGDRDHRLAARASLVFSGQPRQRRTR